MNTPWGHADLTYTIAPGVTGVSTPGHGGIIVDTSAFDLDERLRSGLFTQPYGTFVAFEEDSDAAALVHVHPELLAPAIASGYFGSTVTPELIAESVSYWRPHLVTSLVE